jgi:AcrR family transcriptional regulator
VESDGEKQIRGEKLVAAILEATREELARVGLEKLRVEDVADRVGVNKTTIYRRWPLKSDLVHAALVAICENDLPLPDTGNLHDDLVQLLDGASELMSSPQGRGIFQAMLAEHADGQVAALAQEIRTSEKSRPMTVLRRAKKRGELHAWVDDQLLLDILIGAVQHRILFERAKVDEPYLQRLVTMVLGGVKATATRSRSLIRARRPARRGRAAD